MNKIFAVFFPTEEDALSADEQALFDERQEARKNRDFQKADATRKALEQMGIIVEDSAKGTRWRRRRP